MRPLGVVLIIIALVCAGFGYSQTSPGESSFEAGLGKELANHNPYLPSNSQEAYDSTKASRVLHMQISFGVAGVLFLAGFICVAASPTKSVEDSVQASVKSSDAPQMISHEQCLPRVIGGAEIKSKLEKLLELKSAELITEADFEKQKAALLADFVRPERNEIEN